MAIGGVSIQPAGAAFTAAKLKRVYDHKMMNEGSLWLMDFRHSLGSFAGVPVDQSQIGNVARKQLAARAAAAGLGAIDPAAASMQATVRRYYSANPSANDTRSRLERTTKGGLHMAQTQTVDAANSYSVILPPSTAKAYVDAIVPASGPGPIIGFVLYRRITRAQIAIGSGLEGPSAMSWLASSSNILMSDNGNNATGALVASGGGGQRTPGGIVGPGVAQFMGFGAAGWTTGKDIARQPYVGPHPPDAFQSFNVNKCPSEIVYYGHLCDLTAAGLTLAQWLALEYAEYQATCETAGGAFYEVTEGTNWTDPATFCP